MELTDKVAINNLCGWALYFKRENGVGDIRIPANAKNFSQLDVAEVQMQIQREPAVCRGWYFKSGRPCASVYCR